MDSKFDMPSAGKNLSSEALCERGLKNPPHRRARGGEIYDN